MILWAFQFTEDLNMNNKRSAAHLDDTFGLNGKAIVHIPKMRSACREFRDWRLTQRGEFCSSAAQLINLFWAVSQTVASQMKDSQIVVLSWINLATKEPHQEAALRC